ncbi:MAG: alanine racemase [Paracoccaceae bacterium]
MGTAHLKVDLNAVAANWRALSALSGENVSTAAVVKANGYGLGVNHVARTLFQAGVTQFFTATAEEAATLREAIGPSPTISYFSGHMAGDTDMIRDMALTPIVNSMEQLTRHLENLPGHRFGVQLDTGMNRLGMEPAEWLAVRDIVLAANPTLIMSHLACADQPDHPMNAQQLARFQELTRGLTVPLSLSATGGILLGEAYHFDLTRPGIGLYGGLPFAESTPTVQLSLPVIQIRDLEPGETVGYATAWTAQEPTRIATVSGGYADGLLRTLGQGAMLFHGDTPCPLVGRVSMDLITVDITHLPDAPQMLDLICPQQSIDTLAGIAGTIGYEILTSLGPRYKHTYEGGS